MNGVEQLLNKLEQDRFFGSLEIKFESGKPVLLRKTETIKSLTSDNYRDNRGANHDNTQQR